MKKHNHIWKVGGDYYGNVTAYCDVNGCKKVLQEKEVCEMLSAPPSLNSLMYALMDEARRNSFVDLCDAYGIDYNTEYEEVRNWFLLFGVTL